MATPPFNIAEGVPADNDIVSQFPAAERAFRDIVEDWLNTEHGTSGHHKFMTGTTAARDAITDWEVGSVWFNTTTSKLDFCTAVGPVTWGISLPFTSIAALLSGATFTGNVILTTTGAGIQLTQISTDAGATEAPNFDLDRQSASPAANDDLGSIRFKGRSSTGATVQYAKWLARIITATNGVEDGQMRLQTILAGTLASRLIIGGGLYTPNATGGDKGVDTINASQFYDDNVALPTGVATQADMESGASATLAVSPAVMKNSPGVAKAWGSVTGATGNLDAGYNVASVVRDSQGDYTVTFTNNLSTNNYAVVVQLVEATTVTTGLHCIVRGRAVSNFTVKIQSNGVDFDPDEWTFVVFGDF